MSLFDLALLGDGVAEAVERGRIRGGGRGAVFLLDLQVDFLAMDGDIARGGDAKPDLIATDLDDRDLDLIADLDALVQSSCQN